MFHLMAVHGAESLGRLLRDRPLAFIGRGRTVAAPQALTDAGPLSGSAGLGARSDRRDPASDHARPAADGDDRHGHPAWPRRATARWRLVGKYQDRHLADRVFELAWTHSRVTLRQINATEADAQLYARLASSVIYANASLRADAGVLLRNRRGQSGLWGYAISGDLPIVLLQIGDAANIDLVRQLVQAHAYWRLKGLAVDLVIWNEDRGGYRQVLQDQIMGLIAAGVEAHVIDRPAASSCAAPSRSPTRTASCCNRSRARSSPTAAAAWPSRSMRRGPAEVRVPRLVPTRRTARRGRAAPSRPRAS